MFDLMPFESTRKLTNYFDNFEKNFFKGFAFPQMNFKTDIIEKEDLFQLEAELPGFGKDDISIDINGNYMTIKAERNEEKDEKDDKGNYIRRERSYGAYTRSFDISNIKTDEIEAAYNDGILNIILPKITKTIPKTHRIEIK